MSTRPTLKDVAKLADTSVMTVSRVINNRPGVNISTKQKVKDAILKLGYKPHMDARALRLGITGRIGIIVSDIRNPFYSELTAFAEDLARENNLTIIVSDTSRRLDIEKKAIEELVNVGVDAIIIAPEGFENSHLKKYNKMTPIYSFGVHIPDVDLGEAWIDEEYGGEIAGKYLKSKNLKKVHLIMGNPRKFTTRGRIKGFKKGFGHIEGLSHIEVEWLKAYQIGKEMKNLPDAFFCYNDLIASGVIKALNERGVRVKEDISVISYDDTYLSELLGITTLKIPIVPMITTLFSLFKNNKITKIKFKPELVIRNTA